ncbi:hypothetical protein PInf_008660 [Phytophthora infestans]|nr:hypothetical protein PInf_008660 [Phytophthora infestans]
MGWMRFSKDLYGGCIGQVCILSDIERVESETEELGQLNVANTAESKDTISAKTKKQRFDEPSRDTLKMSPFYDVLRERKNVIPEAIPWELPPDKSIQHPTDLVPGKNYCVMRQWPPSRDQSSHSAPTLCVKKP